MTSSLPTIQAIRWVSPGAPDLYTRLDRNRITIGRDEAADVKLQGPGVSRHHAELSRQGPVFAISDRGSTNGTYVNGVRLDHGALSAGDVLRFGDVIGVVLRRDADEEARGEPDVLEVTPGAVFGPGLRAQLAALRRGAASDLPIVVTGATGTGKECVARTVHALAGRAGAFQAVNCAALPNAVAEAELFGYRKGAFTGADQAALGHVRAADGGTLFLDELADLSPAVQAKLLRVLQEREVIPLGETRPVRVDVRFVAAIQSSLTELVSQQRLRADLAMRLNGLVLELPALRERRADIAVLLSYFLNRYAGGRPPLLEARLLEDLLLYDWPGNVRELELTVKRLLVLHDHEPKLRRAMLPDSMRTSAPAGDLKTNGEGIADRREHDLTRLAHELEKNGRNLAQAAKAVGVSRQRAYRLLGGKSVAELLAASPREAPREDDGG